MAPGSVAIVTPLAGLLWLATLNWRLALLAVLTLPIYAVAYTLMMRGGAQKYQQYDQATARLSGATVEFVHGIAVVKRFGQAGRSHRRYRDATDGYVHFIGQWTRDTAGHQVASSVGVAALSSTDTSRPGTAAACPTQYCSASMAWPSCWA